MQKKIIIRLDLSDDPHPDTGMGFDPKSDLKHQVYTYLRDLMDDDSLDFEVVDK